MRTSLVLWGRGGEPSCSWLPSAGQGGPILPAVPSLSGPLPHNKGKSKDKQQAYPLVH